MLRKYLVDPQSLVPGGRKRSSMVDRHEVDDLILFLERASEPKMKLFQKADEFIEKIVLRPKAK